MNFENDLQKIILDCYSLAEENSHEFITPEHFLLCACEDELVSKAIINSGGNIELLKEELISYIEENVDIVENCDIEESLMFKTLFLYASKQSEASGRDKIDITHVLATMFSMEECYAAYFMQLSNVNRGELLYYLTHSVDKEVHEEVKESFIEKYTQNLIELRKEDNKEQIVGREDILNRTIQILCRKHKNNPIHVGEAGVGKTSIILALCDLIIEGKIPNKLQNAQVLSLDLGGMLAGTKYRGDFEERMKNLLEEIKSLENPILYIDEIHNIVGAGALSAGSLDASNLLKPYLME
ncbi:MAG: AAA family ATPase, partial [Clostridium sp.]